MANIDVTLTLTDAQATKLNKLRQYYNYETASNLDKHQFATMLVTEAAHKRWKEYHQNFATILEAYATATEAEQAQIKSILGL